MKREEWLVVVYLIFRPSQGLLNSCFLPTACAVGCILSPLHGFSGLLRFAQQPLRSGRQALGQC